MTIPMTTTTITSSFYEWTPSGGCALESAPVSLTSIHREKYSVDRAWMPQRRAHVIPPPPPLQRRDASLAPTRPHLLLRPHFLEESLDGGADLGEIRLRREELPDEFASSRRARSHASRSRAAPRRPRRSPRRPSNAIARPNFPRRRRRCRSVAITSPRRDHALGADGRRHHGSPFATRPRFSLDPGAESKRRQSTRASAMAPSTVGAKPSTKKPCLGRWSCLTASVDTRRTRARWRSEARDERAATPPRTSTARSPRWAGGRTSRW